MNKIRIGFVLALCLAPLALSACGEDWVPVYSDTVFPYGNERTAGSGVVYVRKSMLPAKDVKVVIEEEAEDDAVAASDEKSSLHDAFLGSQSK